MIATGNQLTAIKTDYASSILLNDKVVKARQKILTLQASCDRVDGLLNLPQKKLFKALPGLFENCGYDVKGSFPYRDLSLKLATGSFVGGMGFVYFGACSGTFPLAALCGAIIAPILSVPLSRCLTNRKIACEMKEKLMDEKNRTAAEIQNAKNELDKIESELPSEPANPTTAKQSVVMDTSEFNHQPSIAEDAGYIIIDGIRLKKLKEEGGTFKHLVSSTF